MNKRILYLKKSLINQELDALFTTNSKNILYLSGFRHLSSSQREAYMLITSKQVYFLTYSTIFGLVKNQKNGIKYICLKQKFELPEVLNTIVKKISSKGRSAFGRKKIGFETQNLTVGELDLLEKKVACTFIKTKNMIEDLRVLKSKEEIAKIRQAAIYTDNAFKYIQTKITPGITELDLALDIEFFLKKNAGDVAFSPIVAFNQGSAIPHYFPTTYKLQPNSLILLDFGAKYDGYCSDMTRVIFFGTPDTKKADIYATVVLAEQKAIEAIKPGVTGETPDTLAKKIIAQKGYIPYLHGLGHGVGLAIHEQPRLRQGVKDVLKENMVVTVEPGIYLEGLCGVRIEDLVLLTKDGGEVLSRSTKEMIII